MKLIMLSSIVHLKNISTNFHTQLWSCVSSLYLFLMGAPNVALNGIIVLICIDIATRLRANATKYGGYINATKTGKIKSRLVVRGLLSKLISYFVLIIIANISSYIVPLEAFSTFLTNTVYIILFLVEAQSILENLLDAEPQDSDNKKVIGFFLNKVTVYLNSKIKTDEENTTEEKTKEQ